MENSFVSMLVVDDSIPFRSFIYSTIATRVNLLVSGEASDGLGALNKTKEMLPDLILLYIGPPTLDGVSAAREICGLCASHCTHGQNRDRNRNG